jgi:hypothetical protein
MRVMVMVKGTKETEAGTAPTEQALAEMNRFNDELLRAGVLLAGDGLKPTRHGKRVRFSGGKRAIIDGPFTETKEFIAGYELWEVKSMEEAMEWIRRFPDPPGDEWEIELRPLFDLAEDGFGPAVTPEERARAEREPKG